MDSCSGYFKNHIYIIYAIIFFILIKLKSNKLICFAISFFYWSNTNILFGLKDK